MFKIKVDDEISLCLENTKHAERMFYLIDIDREYLSQWLPWPKFTNKPSDHADFVQHVLKQYAEGKALPCCIEYKGEIVGAAGLTVIEKNLKRGQIGYWLASSHQGKGIMTRACSKIIEIAFHELDLEKVQLSAAEKNKPSRAIAERLGMKLEGIITNAEAVGDRIIDLAVYGLRKPENNK